MSARFGPEQLAEGVLRGDRRSAARLISLIEDGRAEAAAALRLLYVHTGRAHLVGVTGSPGAGKSTLVGQLAREYRRRGRKVGVIAVDPTSPYSGGALLGDRIRMQEVGLDPGVFIRSMATRGAHGGIASATLDAARVLDAFGSDVVLLETVGAGQDDIAVARLAHTVVVVVVPDLGDEVQAIKAGILETADVFAVNQADRGGAEKAAAALGLAIDRGRAATEWTPPIVKTVATTGEGVPALASEIESHLAHLRSAGLLERWAEARARAEVEEALKAELLARLLAREAPDALDSLARRVAARELDARTAAATLLDRSKGVGA